MNATLGAYAAPEAETFGFAVAAKRDREKAGRLLELSLAHYRNRCLIEDEFWRRYYELTGELDDAHIAAARSRAEFSLRFPALENAEQIAQVQKCLIALMRAEDRFARESGIPLCDAVSDALAEAKRVIGPLYTPQASES